MKKVIIGLAVGLLAMATVGVASAAHDDDTRECGYTTAVRSWDHNVVIGITADEQGYYFEMDDPDLNVTILGADRYRVHFTEADAGGTFTFYAQAYTPSPDYSFCEVHGALRVKGG